VEAAKTRGMTTAQALAAAVDARRTAELNRQTQRDVAEIYTSKATRDTNLQTRIDIRANALRGQFVGVAGVEEWMIRQAALALVNMEARFDSLQRAVNSNNADANAATLLRQEEIATVRTTKVYEFNAAQMEAAIQEINTRYDAIDAQIRRQVTGVPGVGGGTLLNPAGGGPAGGGPAVGTVRGGFRFTGGDPTDSTNWEPI